MNSVDLKFKVHSELPGHLAPGGVSIPTEICVTAEKPEIVILNNLKKEIHMSELTCPSELHVEKRHLEKSDKYAYYIRDCTEYKCTVNFFEVSSKGFLTTRNHLTLH